MSQYDTRHPADFMPSLSSNLEDDKGRDILYSGLLLLTLMIAMSDPRGHDLRRHCAQVITSIIIIGSRSIQYVVMLSGYSPPDVSSPGDSPLRAFTSRVFHL